MFDLVKNGYHFCIFFFSELFQILKYSRIARILFGIINPDSGVNRPVYSWFLHLPLYITTRLSTVLAKLMICLHYHYFNLKWLNRLTSLIATSIIDTTEEDKSCVVNDTFILENLFLLKYLSLNFV